jgi:hypothetical protein
MVLRRNGPPARPAIAPVPVMSAYATGGKPPGEDDSLKARIEQMSAAHVVTGLGAGAVGNALGVLIVGQGWLGPKAAAGLLMGTGAAAATAGYFMESDHVMVAGAGLSVAGTFSLANQYAVYAYEEAERRAEEKAHKQLQERRNASPLRVVMVRDEPDEMDEQLPGDMM